MKKTDKSFNALCRAALDVGIDPDSDRRIWSVLEDELAHDSASSINPVMTLPELAEYLRSDCETVSDHLEEIPCFEFAGKILFRKESIDEWIEKKERIQRQEIVAFNLYRDTKSTIA